MNWSVVSQVGQLFIMIMAGFLIRRLAILDQSSIKGLSALIMKLTLPAMIFNSMANEKFTPQTLAEGGQILLVSLVIYAILIVLAIPTARLLSKQPEDQGVLRFVLVFSNVGFMGFPVIEAVLGPKALFYTAIYNLPFNLLVFTVGVLILYSGQGKKQASISWKTLISPVIIALVAGFAVFLLQWPLPEMLAKPLSLLGGTTTPLSMLLVGALLGGTSIRQTLRSASLYGFSVFRLLIWPLSVFFCLRLIFDNPLLVAVPTIITAMPAAANAALLAHEHQANETLASKSIFVSTLLSIFSISIVLAIMGIFSA